jgi:predicted phosphodiesterase
MTVETGKTLDVQETEGVPEINPRRDRRRLKTGLGIAGLALAGGTLGAGIGAANALHEPTHVTELAGTSADISLDLGKRTDTYYLDGLLRYEGPGKVAVAGEPVGVTVHLNTSSDTFFDRNGNFSSKVVPAFAQLFSDPEQMKDNVVSAIVRDVRNGALSGAAAGGLAGAALAGGFIAGRRLHQRRLAEEVGSFSEDERSVIVRWQQQRRARQHQVVSSVARVAVVGGLVWGGQAVYSAVKPETQPQLHANPVFDGTPLEGGQISGTLKEPLENIVAYYRDYIMEGNTYYEDLAIKLRTEFQETLGSLPHDEATRYIVIASDRHCNIGMDRVIAEAAELFEADVFVSAGDDNLSGTFGFEPGCTAGLATKLKQLKVRPVSVLGNHDSQELTAKAEKRQGFTVLDDATVRTVGGIRFLGMHDPRRSIFGEGTVPSGAEATAAVEAQAEQVAAAVCDQDQAVDIAVLHDPEAMKRAVELCPEIPYGISGHTHRRDGWHPSAHSSNDFTRLFTQGSSGGAPSAIDDKSNPLNLITVGPLRHNATLDVIAWDTDLRQITANHSVTFTPDGAVRILTTPMVVPTTATEPVLDKRAILE